MSMYQSVLTYFFWIFVIDVFLVNIPLPIMKKFSTTLHKCALLFNVLFKKKKKKPEAEQFKSLSQDQIFEIAANVSS